MLRAASNKELPTTPCRLFPIFARSAPRAVIFRRGPSDWTRLILWHTDTDEFEPGQWFKGRIFFRRSDMSPDGEKLIYFARKVRKKPPQDEDYIYSWTAISKPPYYTALALWPKGNTWHGGGLFIDDRTVFLNHKPAKAIPHPDHLPRDLDVRPNPNATGEDDPVFSEHLSRDGWQVQQEWVLEERRTRGAYFVTIQPEVRVKRNNTKRYVLMLTRRMDDLDYSEQFDVQDSAGRSLLDTHGVLWLDWDQRDRLILFRSGKVIVAEEDEDLKFQVRELADFSSHKPKRVVAPGWATKW